MTYADLVGSEHPPSWFDRTDRCSKILLETVRDTVPHTAYRSNCGWRRKWWCTFSLVCFWPCHTYRYRYTTHAIIDSGLVPAEVADELSNRARCPSLAIQTRPLHQVARTTHTYIHDINNNDNQRTNNPTNQPPTRRGMCTGCDHVEHGTCTCTGCGLIFSGRYGLASK